MSYIGPIERKSKHKNHRGCRPCLDYNQVQKIRSEALNGKTIKAIAMEYGVTRPTVSAALYGLGAYRERE